MKINAPCSYTWASLSAFGLSKYGSKWLSCSAYYFEIAKKFKINPILLALWAVIRSDVFSSKEYHNNMDIYKLGGRYGSYYDAITTGASELAKLDNTSMLAEQKEIEALYEEFERYVNGLAPIKEPPAPPKPPVEPIPKPKKEEPLPKEPEKDAPPTNWKKNLSWIGGLASALLVVWSVVSLALPGWASTAGRIILQLLSSVFGG